MISTINGNALSIPLPDKVVQCVITSPPYWGLRDYGVVGQIGLEPTPQAYVSNIVAVMRECWRVMRDDGTLWLVIGDSYIGYKGKNYGVNPETSNLQSNSKVPASHMIGTPQTSTLKSKDLVGIPWRVAFALQDDGWYLRSDIIWAKPNPMPESVTDRPTKAHEYIFLMAKSQKYYYDAEAIREPHVRLWDEKNGGSLNGGADWTMRASAPTAHKRMKEPALPNPAGRNRRSVWTVATSPYSGAHFATFPPALVEPMILVGSCPGDIVLDPFAGTSTVGRVCAKHGRQFVGVELNPAYIELAENRTSGVQIMLSAYSSHVF